MSWQSVSISNGLARLSSSSCLFSLISSWRMFSTSRMKTRWCDGYCITKSKGIYQKFYSSLVSFSRGGWKNELLSSFNHTSPVPLSQEKGKCEVKLWKCSLPKGFIAPFYQLFSYSYSRCACNTGRKGDLNETWMYIFIRKRTIQLYVNSMLKDQPRHVNNVYFADSGINEVDRQAERPGTRQSALLCPVTDQMRFSSFGVCLNCCFVSQTVW